VLRLDGALDGNRALRRGKSKAVSSHRSPRKKDPESHAEMRRVGDRVPQLPMTFCGNEGVLECSGLTELWMGRERADGEIQSGVKPPQSKKKPACLWAAVCERKGGAGNEALAKSKAVSSHRSPRNKDPA
jgi:hypothetical protein